MTIYATNWITGYITGTVLRIQDVYAGSRIIDLNFSIPDPRSGVKKIPDPDPHQRI
jgi:hypothetical protein